MSTDDLKDVSLNRLRLEGLGLVAAAASFCLLVGTLATSELRSINDQISAVEARVERFSAHLVDPVAPNSVDLSSIVANVVRPDEQSAIVQGWIVDDAERAGLILQQLSPAESRLLDEDFSAVAISLDARGDIRSWTEFLTYLAARRPAVFIRRMDVSSGGLERLDERLRVNLVIEFYATGMRLGQ